MTFTRFLQLPLLVLALVLASACENYGGSAKSEESMPAVSTATVTQYFIVEEDGRLYKFDDAATFRSFQAVGETTFRLTRIGAGAHGETIVYGLSKDQKKLGADASVVMIDDGRQTVEGPFYGELHREGRIYVFDRFEDIQPVLELDEPNLRYAMIGAGPRGETVVIVLRSDNKKQKPEALIEAFNTFNGIS